MLPPTRPYSCFHLVRADDLPVQDRALKAGRQLLDAVDHAVGVRLELFAVRLGGQACGTHCVNIDMHVLALGRERLVEHRRDADVGERQRAPARPATASWNAPSMSSSDSASTMVPPCTSGSKPGLQRNSGSRSSARFTFTVPLRVFQRSMVGDEVGGQLLAVESCLRNVIFGWRGGDHHAAPRSPRRPRARRRSRCPPRTRIRSTGASRDARSRRTPRAARAHRLRHAAHAALGKPPAPHLPVADVADLVVGHHVRGARRARAGPGADHAAHAQDALHLRRLEMLLEQVGDARAPSAA